jgi:hypothetical protein
MARAAIAAPPRARDGDAEARLSALRRTGPPLDRAELKAGGASTSSHQLTPLALRYATPASAFGIPYVLGPHAGSLTTPAFVAGVPLGTAVHQAAEIDRFRLEADPWLRRSFAGAACIIGVAPYVRTFWAASPSSASR